MQLGIILDMVGSGFGDRNALNGKGGTLSYAQLAELSWAHRPASRSLDALQSFTSARRISPIQSPCLAQPEQGFHSSP
jgi:hypothetical protein